jgi:hypothetical protein
MKCKCVLLLCLLAGSIACVQQENPASKTSTLRVEKVPSGPKRTRIAKKKKPASQNRHTKVLKSLAMRKHKKAAFIRRYRTAQQARRKQKRTRRRAFHRNAQRMAAQLEKQLRRARQKQKQKK